MIRSLPTRNVLDRIHKLVSYDGNAQEAIHEGDKIQEGSELVAPHILAWEQDPAGADPLVWGPRVGVAKIRTVQDAISKVLLFDIHHGIGWHGSGQL